MSEFEINVSLNYDKLKADAIKHFEDNNLDYEFEDLRKWMIANCLDYLENGE